MGWLDPLERLINEHGSASLLRERIALANDQYAVLQGKLDAAEAEKARLNAELESARAEVAELRRHQAEVERQRHDKSARASDLSAERVAVLKAVCLNDGAVVEQIAGIAGLSVQITQWHLDALSNAHYVSSSTELGMEWMGTENRTDYTVYPAGRAYLAERGLLD